MKVYDIRQLAAPVSESIVHTQRTRMAVTSVTWQKSEIPVIHNRSGYDPILGQVGSSDGRQDAYMDNIYAMEPTTEDDELRVNPPVSDFSAPTPFLQVLNARDSTTLFHI